MIFMSNELVTTQQGQIVNYTQEQIDLIKSTIAKDATDLELKMFLSQCERTGLDAITRQIYFIKNPKDGKVQIQTSIDGFRLIAERSEKYEGQTKPEWCGSDGKWMDVWLSNSLPSAARVGVWKRGFKEALYAVAIFDEYAQRKYGGELTYMWAKMPVLMISKVAESLALRKAFPNEMSGIYTSEEMGQDDTESQDDKPKTAIASSHVLHTKDKVQPQIEVKKAPEKPVDPRKEIAVQVNKEKLRLGWSNEDIAGLIERKFNKPSNQLSLDEMNELLASLQSNQEPKL